MTRAEQSKHLAFSLIDGFVETKKLTEFEATGLKIYVVYAINDAVEEVQPKSRLNNMMTDIERTVDKVMG